MSFFPPSGSVGSYSESTRPARFNLSTSSAPIAIPVVQESNNLPIQIIYAPNLGATLFETSFRQINSQLVQTSVNTATPGTTPPDAISLNTEYQGVVNAEVKKSWRKAHHYMELLKQPEKCSALMPILRSLAMFDLHRHLAGSFTLNALLKNGRDYALYIDAKTLLFSKTKGENSLTMDELEERADVTAKLTKSLQLFNTREKATNPFVDVKFHEKIFATVESNIEHVPDLTNLYKPIVEALAAEKVVCGGILNEQPVAVAPAFAENPLDASLIKAINDLPFNALLEGLEQQNKDGALGQLWNYFTKQWELFKTLRENYEPLQEMAKAYNTADNELGVFLRSEYPISDPRCSVTLEVYRELSRKGEDFLWHLFCADYLIDETDLVKGYSPVGSEKNLKAIRLCRVQMLALRFVADVRKRNPLTLHIGEFTSTQTGNEVRTSVYEAYMITRPPRGSHLYAWSSLDIAEQKTLLDLMVKDRFILEGLLDSAEKLSGIKTNMHPMHELWKDIQLVLGTDDPACFGTEIVREVVKYLTEYADSPERGVIQVKGNFTDLISITRNNFFALFGCREDAEFFYKRDGSYTFLKANHFQDVRNKSLEQLCEQYAVEDHPWRYKILLVEKNLLDFEKLLNREFDKYYGAKLSDELKLWCQNEKCERLSQLVELHGCNLDALRNEISSFGNRPTEGLHDLFRVSQLAPYNPNRFAAPRSNSLVSECMVSLNNFVHYFKNKWGVNPDDIDSNHSS